MTRHPSRFLVEHWPAFLRDYRATHNLSQKHLADYLSVPKRTVEGWEQGEFPPPPYLKRALNDIQRELLTSARRAPRVPKP